MKYTVVAFTNGVCIDIYTASGKKLTGIVTNDGMRDIRANIKVDIEKVDDKLVINNK